MPATRRAFAFGLVGILVLFVAVALLRRGSGFLSGQVTGGQGSSSSVACLVSNVCGNAVVELNEECDNGGWCEVAGQPPTFYTTVPGANDCITRGGFLHPLSGDGCSDTCKREFCGDGIVQERGRDGAYNTADDEMCDNGKTCKAHPEQTCRSDQDCNISYGNCVQIDGTFRCQDDPHTVKRLCFGPQDCTVTGDTCVYTPSAACTSACKTPLCGNGVIDSGEQCDNGNGNGTAGNSCTTTCRTVSSSSARSSSSSSRSSSSSSRSSSSSSRSSSRSSSSSSRSSSRSSVILCVPGTRCPDQQLCPQNGICPPGSSSRSSSSRSSSRSSVVTCVPGTRCPDQQLCPQNGICPPGSSSSRSSVVTCVPGRICPNGAVCPQNGICPASSSSSSRAACVPGTTCPNGFVCPQNGVCPGCGDGIWQISLGEDCDHGANNGRPGNTCSTQCHLVCTNTSQCPKGDTCIGNQCQCTGSSCPSSSPGGACGNGKLDAGEQCDDGNTRSNDGCSGRCTLEGFARCGDGILQNGELCDDGNSNDKDACSNACKLGIGNPCQQDGECATDLCKDGVCTACTKGSQCQSGICQAGRCLNLCGNARLDPGEVCDDGNQENNDACTNLCRKGNGQSCTEPVECDSNLCTNNTCRSCVINADCPSNLCQSGRCVDLCGNGKVDAGETCDDGNRVDGDACSNACRLGNGSRCTEDQQCDSGLCKDGVCGSCTVNSECASNRCVNGKCLLLCGNRTLDPGEQCDDGNTASGDGCNNRCQLEAGVVPVCGDTIIEQGEQCDDGAANSDILPDHCRTDCSQSRCGDGVLDGGEQCDDGNTQNGDSCDQFCRSGPGGGPLGTPCTPGSTCADGSTCPASGYCPVGGNGNNTGGPGTNPATGDVTGTPPNLNSSGPATVAVLAAGAAAGVAWVRRRRSRK